jgi:hypothetical protein
MWDATMEGIFLEPSDVPPYRRADTHIVSAADRPESAEYDRFAYLVKLFADRGYDEARIREDCPFLVQDVLFNALLARAGRDLAEIASTLGEDPTPFEEQSKKTAHAINEKLWDGEHGFYLDFDLIAGRKVRVYTSPNLAGPLYAGIPDEERARRIVERLKSPSFGLHRGDDGVPVPCYDTGGASGSLPGKVLARPRLDQHRLVPDERPGTLRL